MLRDQIKGVIPSNQMTCRKLLHLGLNQCIILCTCQQMRRAETHTTTKIQMFRILTDPVHSVWTYNWTEFIIKTEPELDK